MILFLLLLLLFLHFSLSPFVDKIPFPFPYPKIINCYVGVTIDGYGNGLFLLTNDSGLHWFPLLQGPLNVTSITLPTPTSFVAVGGNGQIVYQLYPNIWVSPLIMNIAYAVITPPTAENFRSVEFSSPLVGIVGGSNGVLYRTIDGGITWNSVSPNRLFRTINKIHFCNETKTFFAVGNGQLIIMSNDFGLQWSLVSPNGLPSSVNFYSVDSFLSRVIIVGNGAIVMSSNGLNWTDSFVANNFNPNISIFNSVSFFTPNDIFVSGAFGLLCRSVDGGASFTMLNFTLSVLGSNLDVSSRITNLKYLYSNFHQDFLFLFSQRNRIFESKYNGGTSWSESTEMSNGLQINFIESFAILSSPILSLNPKDLFISVLDGKSFQFNISLSNIGNEMLTLGPMNSSSPFLQLTSDSPIVDGISISPIDSPIILYFICDPNALSESIGDVNYLSITFDQNSPTEISVFSLSVLVVSPPIVISTSFISAYWWVIALVVAAVSLIILYFLRRRFIRIKRYNRRVTNEEFHLSFWRFLCFNKVEEHGEDSDFWEEQNGWESEEEEEEEEEGEDEEDEGGEEEGEDDGEDGEEGEEDDADENVSPDSVEGEVEENDANARDPMNNSPIELSPSPHSHNDLEIFSGDEGADPHDDDDEDDVDEDGKPTHYSRQQSIKKQREKEREREKEKGMRSSRERRRKVDRDPHVRGDHRPKSKSKSKRSHSKSSLKPAIGNDGEGEEGEDEKSRNSQSRSHRNSRGHFENDENDDNENDNQKGNILSKSQAQSILRKRYPAQKEK